MSRKPLILALILATLSVVLMLLYVRRFEREMSGGDRVRLLVALKPLKRGMVVTDEHLTYRDVPIAYVEERAIRANDQSKIVGVRVANPIQAQAILMWSDLAVASEEKDLSGLIEPGSRAVTVRANNADERKSNALIRPGDYVDVLATMSDPTATSEISTDKAVVLLQRVLVLAIGLNTEPQAAAGAETKGRRTAAQSDLVLTLSLNLQEAQLLALATRRGELSVVLRNPEDQRVIEGLPDMQVKSLFDSAAREKIQKPQAVSAVVAAEAEEDEGPIKLE